LIETSPDAIAVTDLNGRITFVSNLTLELHGYELPEEMIGKNALDFIIPAEHKAARLGIKIILKKGHLSNVNCTMLRKDKSRFIGELNAAVISDAHGQPRAFIGTVRDITERKKSDNELHDSLQTATDIIASIPSGLFIYQFEEPDRLILIEANHEAAMLTGITIDQWRGKEFNEIWPEAYESGITEAFVNVIKTGKTYVNEDLNYKDSRLEAAFRVRAFSMTRKRLGVAFENVTERIRVYEALRESEERNRFLFKNLPVMLHSTDRDGRLVDVSNQWLETLGYDRKDVIGKKSTNYLTAESRRYAQEVVLPEYFESGRCQNVPYQFVKKDGTVLDALLSEAAQFDKEGKVVRSFAVIIDVTKLKAVEKRIMKFFRTVEQSPNTVMIINLDGLIDYVNPRFIDVTGYTSSEVLGKKPPMFGGSKDGVNQFDRIWKIVSAGEKWTGNLQNQRKNGELYSERFSMSPMVDDNGQTINYLAIGEDITHEIMAHQKLAEIDKLSAIGLLAAGVAHEFKNYLCGIIGNASLIIDDEDDIRDTQKVKESLSSIIKIGDRAANLATSLLTYSKAQPEHYQLGNLRNIIDQTMTLVGKEMRQPAINLLTHLEEVPDINVSIGKIQQMILNLLTNALHAIKSGGFIMVSLLRREEYIYFRVADTGCGISQKMLSRVFDPFFSTKGVWGKDAGLGTGMGLAICRNIALEHKGNLSVESIVGAGAIFTLALPVAAWKKDIVPPGPFKPQVTILLNTRDKDIVEKYFNQAHELGASIFVFNSVEHLEDNIRPTTDLILLDGTELEDRELTDTKSYCANRQIALTVINKGSSKPHSNYAGLRGLTCFDDLPDLAEVIGAIAGTPVRSVP
jgi:PAS domain S-box-containing protein